MLMLADTEAWTDFWAQGAAPPAVVRGSVAGDDGRQEAADVVAGRPEAPECAALAVRVPGRQDARARWRP